MSLRDYLGKRECSKVLPLDNVIAELFEGSVQTNDENVSFQAIVDSSSEIIFMVFEPD